MRRQHWHSDHDAKKKWMLPKKFSNCKRSVTITTRGGETTEEYDGVLVGANNHGPRSHGPDRSQMLTKCGLLKHSVELHDFDEGHSGGHHLRGLLVGVLALQ